MVVILTPHRFYGGWNPRYKGLFGPSSAAGWAKVFDLCIFSWSGRVGKATPC